MPDRTTFDATIGALEATVDRCADTGDRIGYFAAMYIAVTGAVRQRATAGRFEDAARMERFVTRFAGRYLDALDAWRAGRPCSASWRAAFETTRQRRPIVLQHLLLGMNAHINLDLGITVAQLGPAGTIDAVRADFDAMNDVLGGLIDGCEAALDSVSPWIGLADRIGGSGDEKLIRFSLVVARRQAWSAAVRLSSLDGARLDAEIDAIDRATAGVAYVVAHPGLLASAALAVVRLRERAAPAEIMRRLAAVQTPA